MISNDIKKLKAIVSAEQSEGAERLLKAGIVTGTKTIEEVIDKMARGGAFTSSAVAEEHLPLDTVYTST